VREVRIAFLGRRNIWRRRRELGSRILLNESHLSVQILMQQQIAALFLIQSKPIFRGRIHHYCVDGDELDRETDGEKEGI
jgi:hypothetical protein